MINRNGSAEFLVSTNRSFGVSPEFVGSRLLLRMRSMAERRLGARVHKAVVSVPADFDERQRNYTVKAAQLAGPCSSSASCHRPTRPRLRGASLCQANS